MLNEWQRNFNTAEIQHQIVMFHGAIPTHLQREAAAIEFAEWYGRFKDGAESAMNVLETELKSSDTMRRHCAARLYIYAAEPDKLARLSVEAIHSKNLHLPFDVLKSLWISSPPNGASELFWQWVRHNVPERFPLLDALLAKHTDQAVELFKQILESGHSKQRSPGVANINGSQAVRLVAGWGHHPLLQNVLHNYRRIDTNQWWGNDPQVEAAFYSGLNGDDEAIAFLEAIAKGANTLRATEACQRLACLALPSAVEATAALLGHEDGNVAIAALGAASTLRSGALVASLLHLAERTIYADGFHLPVCDEAIRVVRSILTPAICEPLAEEYIDGETETLTQKFRERSIAYYSAHLTHIDKSKRYYNGDPLTLNHLALDLLSPHTQPFLDGAFNLQAITGEDYKFDYDPHSNLISNLSAVRTWRKRVCEPQPLAPGGWAFRGKHIDNIG